jgi:hypothetical protein
MMHAYHALTVDEYIRHPQATQHTKLEKAYLRTQHSNSNYYYNITHYDGPLAACLGVGNNGYGDGFGLRQRGRQRHLGSRPM